MTRALLILALLTSPAYAAPAQCDKREAIVNKLLLKYGEKLATVALQSNGMVLEIHASDSGTYTALVSKPDGTSCIVSMGRDFQVVRREPGMPT